MKETQHQSNVTKTLPASQSEILSFAQAAHSLLNLVLVSSFCQFLKINYNLIGILETIFDGIQRPLKTIAEISKSVFVPRGVDVPSLDQDRLYSFDPTKLFK